MTFLRDLLICLYLRKLACPRWSACLVQSGPENFKHQRSKLQKTPCLAPGWILLALLTTLSSVTSLAADAPRFVTRSWSVEQGLPHSLVNRVVQDARGFLWVATGAGLARFDGVSFKEVALPRRSVSSVSNIRDLFVQPDGSLIVLPASGEIFQWKNGTFSLHPASAALKGNSLMEVYVEPSGVLWAGTSVDVIRWENGKVQVFGQAEGILRRVSRTTFVTDRRGQTWVGAGDFLGCYTNGALTLPPPALLNLGRAVVIAPTRKGGLWISSTDQLLKLEDDHVTVCAESDWPAKRSGINVLFEDSHGNLWVGTRRNGLFLYSGGKVFPVEFEPRTVFSIHEDSEGNIWAATAAEGLCRLRPLAFTLLNRERGLTDEISTSVCEDETGAIWCANRSGGLVRWKDGSIQHVAAGVRAARYPTRIACDRKGNIWLATTNGMLRASIDHPDDIQSMVPPFRYIHVLLGARNGDMWVSSSSALGWFREGVYQPLNGPEGPFTTNVSAMAEDAHGGIWIGTTENKDFEVENRLWEYADGKIIERVSAAKWLGGAIHAMQFDHLGALWIATSAGLILKQGEQMARFTTAEGLPDDLLMEVLIDDLGFVWCGSRRGFFRIAAADLRAVAEGRLKKIIPTVFGQDDGLLGASALTGGQPTAWKAHDGKLWFTTIRGVVGFDPASAQTSTVAPPVFIDSVSMDDQQLSGSTDRIDVPAGSHRLSFHFAALNYAAPERVQLRHRLEGFDEEWIETGPDRTASYVRLPPGHYRLHVIAGNQSGVWNEVGATLPLSVAAAWWQTPWFSGLLALLLAGLVAWVVRTFSLRKISRRLRTLEEENALERERSRIARNLHDELGGSLTQIGLLADRLRRQPAEADVQRTLGQLAWRTRSLAGDLESIVWTVSPQNNSWDRLAPFIAQFARRFFKDTDISCIVTGAESIPAHPLSPEAQHEVLAVLKESLNNVLKHSRASQVVIEMKGDDGAFELSIQDNGIGFVPGLPEHSERNGLNNIRTRGITLRGGAKIESRPGEGTRVVLRAPL